MKLFLLAITLALISTGYGKRFDKCELVRIMTSNGFPRAQMPDWLCLIKNESNFDSGALNTKNSDGTFDYGLFQINNGFFCADQRKGPNDCKIDCSKLRDDDITDDLKCVKLIYKRHNFNAWNGWKKHCKGKKLPSIAEC